MSNTIWVTPSAAFFDRIEETESRSETMPSGRVTAFITSSMGEWLSRPFQTMHPPTSETTRRTSPASRSTRASTSIASAVPAGEVMAREAALGMVSPCAIAMGTTTMVTRVPGMPPIECLSTTIPSGQTICAERSARALAKAITSPSSRVCAAATRNPAVSRPA